MSVVLPQHEIVEIVGGYKRACDQLAELKRQGFYRARTSRITGKIVLERAHYEAVCGGVQPGSAPAPKVRPVPKAVR